MKREWNKTDRRKVLVVPDMERTQKPFGPSFAVLLQKLSAVYEQFSEEDMKVIIQYLDNVSTAMTEVAREMKEG